MLRLLRTVYHKNESFEEGERNLDRKSASFTVASQTTEVTALCVGAVKGGGIVSVGGRHEEKGTPTDGSRLCQEVSRWQVSSP